MDINILVLFINRNVARKKLFDLVKYQSEKFYVDCLDDI